MGNGNETPGTGDTATPTAGRSSWTPILLGVAVLAVGGYFAFRFLNTMVAAFIVIFAATMLAMAVAARGWDQHPDYEARELARMHKRAIKHERNQGARDKDRARWEAHQTRLAEKAAQEKKKEERPA
ncbi:MAG TPA: hypothetical protein VGN47_11825 [Blastococcus sp.]|nr:hypothetical protein [Blastococcus sp.]